MKRKNLLDECLMTTAGVSADNKYSLTIQKYNGKSCLCIHKCSVQDGMHYSKCNNKSLITAISLDSLKLAINEIEANHFWKE